MPEGQVLERVFPGRPKGAFLGFMAFLSIAGPLLTFVSFKRNIWNVSFLVMTWTWTAIAISVVIGSLLHRHGLRIEKSNGGIRLTRWRSAGIRLGRTALDLPPTEEVVIVAPANLPHDESLPLVLRGAGYAVPVANAPTQRGARVLAADIANYLGVGARDCSQAPIVATENSESAEAFPTVRTPLAWPDAPPGSRIGVAIVGDEVHFDLPPEGHPRRVAQRQLLGALALCPMMWLISWTLFDSKIQAQAGTAPLKVFAWITLIGPALLVVGGLWGAFRPAAERRAQFAVGSHELQVLPPREERRRGTGSSEDYGRWKIEQVTVRPPEMGNAIEIELSTGIISLGPDAHIWLGLELTPAERDWLARAIVAGKAGLRPTAAS